LDKGFLKTRAVPIVFSLLIITMLLFAGPAFAFGVSSFGSSDLTPFVGEETTLTVDITKNSNEVIQTVSIVVEDSEGATVPSTLLSCESSGLPGYGYGYGYGFLGYGYGYGYGFGIPLTAGTPLTCTFSVIPSTSGVHSADVLVNGVSVFSDPSVFDAQAPVSTGVTFSLPPNVSITFTTLPSGPDSFSGTVTDGIPPNSGTLNTINFFFDLVTTMVNGTFQAILTVSYDDVDNNGIVDGTEIDEAELNVYFFNGSDWEVIPSPTRDFTGNTISVVIDHFTSFALFSAPSTSGSGGAGTQTIGGGSSPVETSTQTVPEPTPIVEETVPEVTPEPEEETPVETTTAPVTIAPPETLTPTAPTGLFGLGDATGGLVLGVIVVVIVGIAWYTTRRI